MKTMHAMAMLVAAMALAPDARAMGGLPYHATYDVPVPNADFGGGTGDEYRHDGALMRYNLVATHSIEEHIHPWVYREKTESGRVKRHLVQAFSLASAGDYVTQTFELGQPEYVDRKPAQGVRYAIRVPFGARHVESAIKLRVQLRDDDNKVLLERQESSAMATPGWPLSGAMHLEVDASRFPSARHMSLGIKNASGSEVELGEVTVQRTVTSHPIIDLDFDD